jgi:hypothetical protein
MKSAVKSNPSTVQAVRPAGRLETSASSQLPPPVPALQVPQSAVADEWIQVWR